MFIRYLQDASLCCKQISSIPTAFQLKQNLIWQKSRSNCVSDIGYLLSDRKSVTFHKSTYLIPHVQNDLLLSGTFISLTHSPNSKCYTNDDDDGAMQICIELRDIVYLVYAVCCRHLASSVLEDSFLPAHRHVHDDWDKSKPRRLTRRSTKLFEFQQLKVGARVEGLHLANMYPSAIEVGGYFGLSDQVIGHLCHEGCVIPPFCLILSGFPLTRKVRN